MHVLREASLAIGLVDRVFARRTLADELEILGVLELDFGRDRLLRCRLRELAEACLAFGARVHDDALAHAELFGGDLPLPGCRGNEHRARRGPGLAQLLPWVRDRRAAAGALHRPPEQVVVASGIGGGALDTHLRPRRIQFLRHDGGESGVGALAHFDVLADHCHRVVGTNAQEGVRFEGRGVRCCGAGLARARRIRRAQCGGQVGRKRQACRALEEAAAAVVLDVGRVRHDDFLQASDLAASWMAVRMRA